MAYSFSTESFQSVLADWEGLLPNSTVNNIFLTPYWQQTWWESEAAGDQQLRIIKVTEDHRRRAACPSRGHGNLPGQHGPVGHP